MTKRRKIVYGVSSSLLAVGVIGAMHIPAVGRALGIGGCPWDGRVATVQQLEDLRAKADQQLKGKTLAKARPAFGFTLEKTTKDEALAWTKDNGLTCKDVQRGLALDCESPSRDILFRFDPRGVLVEVDVMYPATSPAEAAKQTSSIAAAVTAAAGEPAAKRGEATEEALSKGNWAAAAFEYRFADYAADVSAMSRGDQGVVVRERYRALTVSQERHASR